MTHDLRVMIIAYSLQTCCTNTGGEPTEGEDVAVAGKGKSDWNEVDGKN